MAEGLAVVTGGSSGIGYQLARRAVEDGYDLVVCAHEDRIHEAADKLRRLGAEVEPVQADLATASGVDTLWSRLSDRRIELFFANAGSTINGPVHDQDWLEIKRLIDLHVTQTTSMVHKVGRRMREQGAGRILLTGSIAGFVPGSQMAIYNATKAYLDSFAMGLCDELKGTGVTLTCLMPGLVETRIFERAGMQGALMVEVTPKNDATRVARDGYDAMMAGVGSVTPGYLNKVLAMFSDLVPDSALAEIHRQAARPRN